MNKLPIVKFDAKKHIDLGLSVSGRIQNSQVSDRQTGMRSGRATRARIPITQEMVDCARSEILRNEVPDGEIAAKCLGDPRRTDTVSDMRRSFDSKKTARLVNFTHVLQEVGERGIEVQCPDNPAMMLADFANRESLYLIHLGRLTHSR
jgi:hypothetical protein